MRYVLLNFVILIAVITSTATAQDMPLTQILLPGEDWKVVSEGHQFTEGPAADRDGNLYFVDVPASKIFKLDVVSGKVSKFVEDSGNASGLAFGGDGLLYAAQNGARAIVKYDAAGKPTKIAEDIDVNDLVVTRQNEIYVTDPKNHRLWFINSVGEKKVVDEGIERPNGITLWLDQKTLVVADSASDHLYAFRINANGSLTAKQPYYTLQLTSAAIFAGKLASAADGLKVDRAGRVYCASEAGLQVFDTQGRLSGVIAKPQGKFLSNVAFAGPNFDTLYVTSADKVYSRKVQANKGK
jgi:gluconolactonase